MLRALVLSIFATWSGLAFPARVGCNRDLTLPVQLEVFNRDFIKANGVSVTGEFLYPLSTVLNNLDLKRDELKARWHGKNILSVGEGVSPLLPFLLTEGLAARGLDIWYFQDQLPDNYSGNLMREYQSRYGAHLIRADAEDMDVPDQSEDLILSHMLIYNLPLRQQKNVVGEMIRVLKPGGEARIFGFDSDDMKKVRRFLLWHFTRQVTFEFKPISYKLNFRGRRGEHRLNLLVLLRRH